MEESHDRMVRDFEELERYRDYIKENPVAAKLGEGEFILELWDDAADGRLPAPQTRCLCPIYCAPKNSAFPIGSSQLRMVFRKKPFARNESRKTSPLPTAWSIPARRNLKPILPITIRPTETRTSAAKAVSAKS